MTIASLRAEYNGEAQAGGTPPAYYISHEAGQGGGEDPKPGDIPQVLIISEYAEGSSMNKFIEIANISDTPVDLSAYTLGIYTNGNEPVGHEAALSGTLEAGAVKVYSRSDADHTLLPEGVTAENFDQQVINFNGNDPIAILYNGEIVDIIGTIGDSSDFGKDVTLRRKATVTAPSNTYNPDEWDTLGKEDLSGFGTR